MAEDLSVTELPMYELVCNGSLDRKNCVALEVHLERSMKHDFPIKKESQAYLVKEE